MEKKTKTTTVKVFLNWPIFKILKIVPYLPEVKYVLNICRIRDPKNC